MGIRCGILSPELNYFRGVMIDKTLPRTGFFIWTCKMKTCSKCKVEKPYTDFFKDKSTKSGYHNQCKTCQKQYAIKNADKINQYYKQYRIKNAEKYRQYGEQYYKQYGIDNPEYYKQQYKKYNLTPHGNLVGKAIRHKRRALLRNNTPVGKHFTPADIILKLKLQHNKCIYCEISIKEYYEIDHFIPVSKEGSNEASNIQLLCRECNRTKKAKLPTNYAQKHGMLL